MKIGNRYLTNYLKINHLKIMTVLKIGITGADGFIGRNLREYLAKEPEVEVIPCGKEEFNDPKQLRDFAVACDKIFHFAAISRHPDGQHMYDVNMDLVCRLIKALMTAKKKPHVLFASTTHEAKKSPYHASKRDGRDLLNDWAERTSGLHTCLLLPNTFGPYGKPHYNSVVATFCYKVANGEEPQIMIDAPVQLIYVRELCRRLLKFSRGMLPGRTFTPPHQYEVKVSKIRDLLLEFKDGEKPKRDDAFAVDLYETYQSYL